MTGVVIIIIGVLVMLIIWAIYDGKDKVQKWQDRYITVKQEKKHIEEKYNALNYSQLKLKEDNAVLTLKIAELRDKNKELKERILAKDIETQKSALKKEGC